MTESVFPAISSVQLEAAVGEIDLRLAADPRCLALLIDRAQFLEMLGRKDEALASYVRVLKAEPTHIDALMGVGLLFLAVGNHSAARTCLAGAVLHGPTSARAHALLADLYTLDQHLTGAQALYEEALRLDPGCALAHNGYSKLLARLGDHAGAARHQSLGLTHGPITIERYIGDGRPIYLLAIGTAVNGNIPTFGYFDNRLFLMTSMSIDQADADAPLPPHDVIFNIIGEAELCADQLAKAARLLTRTDAPVINHPANIARTSRAENARRLRACPGVVTPGTIAIPRTLLAGPAAGATFAAAGVRFPLLVRSPGYHTGEHFVKVDTAAEFPAAIADLPGDELLLIEHIDVRDAAGTFRKYRVIIVDGKLYPLHLAISKHWKVHYFSAEMAHSAANRAADAAYLADMPGVLGPRAVAALESIRETLGLDYGGIDFGIAANGDVVVFEANASMVVPFPERGAKWDYRRPHVARIRFAVRDMLVRRAAAGRLRELVGSA